jgi:hypothetical protein
MAAYAAFAGIPAIVLLPENRVSIEQLSQPIAYGARTLALKTDFDGCMRVVAELTRARPVYLLNSMNSVRIEGQKSIVWETIQQLGWRVPDWIVVPVGNAGNISALGKGLLEWRELGLLGPEGRLPRLAGVQAVLANPFARSYRGRFAHKETLTRADGRVGDRDRRSRLLRQGEGRRRVDGRRRHRRHRGRDPRRQGARRRVRHLHLPQLLDRRRGPSQADRRRHHQEGRSGGGGRDGARAQVLGDHGGLPRRQGSPASPAAGPNRPFPWPPRSRPVLGAIGP